MDATPWEFQPEASLGAQAKIWGHIVDAETGDPIEAASVYLGHTLIGSTSNQDGRYTIERIPVGTFSFVVSRIGYKSIQRKIDMSAQDIEMELNVSLTPEVYELLDRPIYKQGFHHPFVTNCSLHIDQQYFLSC